MSETDYPVSGVTDISKRSKPQAISVECRHMTTPCFKPIEEETKSFIKAQWKWPKGILQNSH